MNLQCLLGKLKYYDDKKNGRYVLTFHKIHYSLMLLLYAFQ